MNTNLKMGIVATLIMLLSGLAMASSTNSTSVVNATSVANATNATTLNLPIPVHLSSVSGGYRFIAAADPTGWGVSYNYLPDCVTYLGTILGEPLYFAIQGFTC